MHTLTLAWTPTFSSANPSAPTSLLKRTRPRNNGILFKPGDPNESHVEEATKLVDGRGIGRPLREGADGLAESKFVIQEDEPLPDLAEDGDMASEEEKEAGGILKAERCARWMGAGIRDPRKEGHLPTLLRRGWFA